MRTYAEPWFVFAMKPLPPDVTRTTRTAGCARSSASTASITSCIAAELVPSAAGDVDVELGFVDFARDVLLSDQAIERRDRRDHSDDDRQHDEAAAQRDAQGCHVRRVRCQA
jgi:hypothetical protein